MWLVAGLGNPGPKYEDTRHNIGFLVLDRLRARCQADPPRDKFGASLCEGRCAGERAMLVKPMEYMNLSGQAVARAGQFWKIAPDHMVVVHDEIDLPFARLKVGAGGGHGGHNGVRSIIDQLGSRDFIRVRVGVGRPPAGRSGADYVLGRFAPDEQAQLDEFVERAADAVETILQHGVATAMNRFNVRAPGESGAASKLNNQ